MVEEILEAWDWGDEKLWPIGGQPFCFFFERITTYISISSFP
jgi:hypothetical protein